MLEFRNYQAQTYTLDYIALMAVLAWYEDIANEVYLDKICDAWAVYDEQEIRDVFMFIDNEPLEDMIGTIGSYEYEIIPLDDDRFVIGDPALIKESISC